MAERIELVKVTCCRYCRLCHKWWTEEKGNYYVCLHKEKNMSAEIAIKDLKAFPSWCPLEEVPDD